MTPRIFLAVLDDYDVLKNLKKEEKAKLAAEKAQRRSERIAHFKALLPRAGHFLSLWLHPRRFYREKEESALQSDLQKYAE